MQTVDNIKMLIYNLIMETKEVDKLFDTLYKIWIKFNIENEENIGGIPEFEYKKLEDLYKKDFPYTFSVYFKKICK